MTDRDDPVEALQEAVRLSPDNLPLRQHLAATLLGLGRLPEAEQAFRDALSLAPGDHRIKIGLAGTYYRRGKNSHAMVIVEELLKLADTPPAAYLLHAKLLIRSGNIELAVRQYHKAVDGDPNLSDTTLADQLGIGGQGDVVDGRLRMADGEEDEEGPPPLERPRLKFEDVGGMEGVKDEIRMKIIHPLTHPEIYAAYGQTIGGGILMYGPPGCGKTHLARATAGEISAGFLAIGINDVLEMWIGSSERNLHEIFEQARSSRPCVLFFDEVDALGASRSDMRQSAGRQIINQFLSELDGISYSNEGVLILAATNAPWHLDSAFRRPGRFDRIIFVPPPDAPARAEVLRILVRGKPCEEIDFEYLAKKADGFSGADLKAVVDVAVEAKLKDAMKSGLPKPLGSKDLAAAIKAVKPSTKDWFSTARNYALYSNQSGLYDDVLKHLGMK